jgi:trans-2,3-dihydro-3-hydroxyanthranilate isomerase
MRAHFVLADVFTGKPFGGNQLAVFTDAEGLSDRAMQALAREFNFAESTFVLPRRDYAHTRRVRIFTPRTEVPFAGHPTVGTAAVLVQRKLVGLHADRVQLVLEEGVGPVLVDVSIRGGALTSRVTLDRAPELPTVHPAPAGAAAALSLPAPAVLESWFGSVGLPFCFIRLDTPKSVDLATLDQSAWGAHFSNAWSSNLFFFAQNGSDPTKLYARMFAPAYGINEDPATGSACAALAGALAAASPQRAGTCTWHVEQGVAMGRPSYIEASAEKLDGQVVCVHIGGSTAIVGEGTITVPDGF